MYIQRLEESVTYNTKSVSIFLDLYSGLSQLRFSFKIQGEKSATQIHEKNFFKKFLIQFLNIGAKLTSWTVDANSLKPWMCNQMLVLFTQAKLVLKYELSFFSNLSRKFYCDKTCSFRSITSY